MHPLISTSDLAAALATSDPPILLDVRWRLGGPPGRLDYERGHLPGAVFIDLDADLSGEPGAGGRHPLPEPADLQEVLRRSGVRTGHPVVAYDVGDGSSAARAWWLLRWAGLPAERVAVLDGGYAAWVAAGLPTTADPSRPEPGDIVVRAGAMPVVDADGAAALGRVGVLIDARAAVRYRGENEPIDPVAGHIPGAHNVPVTEFVDDKGRWLPRPVIAERFAGLGVSESAEAGAYCGSGVTAAALVLAAEYAGLRPPGRPLALYAGSWSNWVADPARPVAVGAEP
jgi:thiosulfate/3-mercaptopyruvate sulfurtransferase